MTDAAAAPHGGGSIPWPWSGTLGGDLPFPLGASTGWQFFQPVLALRWDASSKQYSLKSATLVPSGHYSAGPGQDGAVPAGISLIPETHGVTLPIVFNAGPATQAFKVIEHNVLLSGLTTGHQTVTVFTVLQGAVVGASTIGVPNGAQEFTLTPPASSLTAASFAVPSGVASSKVPGPSWAAWINNMPVGPRSLHVIGSVTVPNPGVLVVLRRAVPQGINPAILILELMFVQIPGFWPQVMTTRTVRYEEAPYKDDHRQCSIRWPSGGLVTIDIETVS